MILIVTAMQNAANQPSSFVSNKRTWLQFEILLLELLCLDVPSYYATCIICKWMTSLLATTSDTVYTVYTSQISSKHFLEKNPNRTKEILAMINYEWYIGYPQNCYLLGVPTYIV